MIEERIVVLALSRSMKAHSNLESLFTQYHITDDDVFDKVRQIQQSLRELNTLLISKRVV